MATQDTLTQEQPAAVAATEGSANAAETVEEAVEKWRPTSWSQIAASMAGLLAMPDFDRGDLAELRRMDTESPKTGVFWRLMAYYGQLGNPVMEKRWATVMNGIALMTPSNVGDVDARSAHDGYNPVGRALFLGGEAHREMAFYSETRLNQLLRMDGRTLQIALRHMFNMMARHDVSFNWREMAQFILRNAPEESRQRIAREYYRAMWQSSQRDTE